MSLCLWLFKELWAEDFLTAAAGGSQARGRLKYQIGLSYQESFKGYTNRKKKVKHVL